MNDTSYIERHWLDWCRLCANEDAVINVRHKDVYLRIISKCFDIEMGLEEPALGGMMCNECYGIIEELINFAENVNKVQPIFELLRHTDPSDQVDVFALRQEYGLQNGSADFSYKIKPEEQEFLYEVNEEHGSQISFFDNHNDDQYDDDDVRLFPIPMPVKKKRGRPKGSKNRAIRQNAESNEELQVKVEYLTDYVQEDHICLDDFRREANEITSIKHDHSKTEIFVESEKLEILSPSKKISSTVESEKLKLDQSTVIETSVDKEETIVELPLKRKRGRPRKHQIEMADTQNLKCKNVALVRLLCASPAPNEESEATVRKNNVDDNQHARITFNCNFCNKKLASRMGLKYHIERVHIKKRLYVCDFCGKQVNTGSELKEHLLVHTDDRPFVCPICKAAFKNKKRLNIHSQTHGDPSYECEICGKKLQTRAIWNKHKVVHSNKRRFKCPICGSGIKNSTALKGHLLSHTGLRPYSCKYCNKDFACGASCRDHKMKKHPVEYAKDDDKSSRIQNVPTLDELRALAAGMEKGARLRKPKTIKVN